MAKRQLNPSSGTIVKRPIVEQICDQLIAASAIGLRMGQLFENLRYSYQKKNAQFDMFYLVDEKFLEELKEHIKLGSSPTRV